MDRSRWRNRDILIKTSPIVVTLVAILYSVFTADGVTIGKFVKTSKDGQLKTILMATEFYGEEFSETSLGQLPEDCPYQCQVYPFSKLSDRTILEQADAVVFHQHTSDLVPGLRQVMKYRKFRNSWLVPQWNRYIQSMAKHQRWVLFVLETYETERKMASTHPPVDPKRLNGLFNWTMSYRQDSDVYIPYERFDGFEPGKFQWPLGEGVDIGHKKKHILAIISNCHDSYGRLEFLNQLRNHGITVDVYGRCV